MKHKFQKNLHILSDLMTYFHCFGALDYQIKLSETADRTSFSLSAAVPNFSDENLAELCEALKLPRQLEVEHDFWELSGESDDYELTLTSMMLDSATAHYQNGILSITAVRLE